MIFQYISNQVGIPVEQIVSVVDLFAEGATVPFIARYRKEKTGGLQDTDLFKIQKAKEQYEKLTSRKETILSAIREQGRLNPELEQKILDCYSETALEDLYLPYKKKRKTKATTAREAGLEPLAKIIMAQRTQNMERDAQRFLRNDLTSTDQAIQGAQYIIAEWVGEDIKSREILRENLRKHGMLESKVVGTKKEKALTYKDYWEFSEKLNRCPSHRLLAILRGQNEGLLRVKVTTDTERFIENICRYRIRRESTTGATIKEAVVDAVKRLIFPSVENQVLNEYKTKAEEAAIEVFANNLKQLLLSPPLGAKPILALDPGFRTGCKLVCLDATGGLLEHTTIFPHPPQNQSDNALKVISKLLQKYDINSVAIGDGTAGRETMEWLNRSYKETDVQLFLVNEDGASIYSASPVAREEFPDHDVTVRGSISIGRRLMDPLSELIKIDPKSIGVGQYQHDVSETALKASLDHTVESAVNQVGVDLNTGSSYLLQYIAGLGPATAQKIVQYRAEIGGFEDRTQLMNVPRLGAKSYEQSVGFLRIREGKNPLDNTGIHPETYDLVKQMAEGQSCSILELVGNKKRLSDINPHDYVSEIYGLPTITDILTELIKPGHDPRGEVEVFEFAPNVRMIDDIHPGMILPGIITNLTKFGAFVNIGIKENGLIHISEITDRFISDPGEVLQLNQKVKAKVLRVDIPRGRINLSLKI